MTHDLTPSACEVWLLVGLPRSGKSTWALAHHRETGAPIVSADALRLTLAGQTEHLIPEIETPVREVALVMTEALFRAGAERVIVESDALTRADRDVWRRELWTRRIVEFTADAETCKARARKQEDSAWLVDVIDRHNRTREALSDKESADVVQRV